MFVINYCSILDFTMNSILEYPYKTGRLQEIYDGAFFQSNQNLETKI